jgi:hypothetical protein
MAVFLNGRSNRTGKQGSGTVSGSDGGVGNCLWPPGYSVNYCEQVTGICVAT